MITKHIIEADGTRKQFKLLEILLASCNNKSNMNTN